MQTPHLDQAYEDELQHLSVQLSRTAARAEQMLRDAVRALISRDTSLARQVMDTDRELDRLEVELDKLCIVMLARRSPVGEDLRLVLTALKSDVDMERIGDLAGHVAERAIELAAGAGISAPPEVLELANGSVELVGRAMKALADRDGEAARAVIVDDRKLDNLHGSVIRRMIQIAKDHPDQLERSIAWSSVSRQLERAADHACNIAEMTVFLAEGQVLRHAGLKGNS
ncbi:MAG: phosphate signaling complex protein PhoU [Deltaproteobacteria bacterium]|nr:phosphate signaling complex protein PhoU [Deltaproteobacteria bacterium]MBM4389492.1 phosphate signaling complex protein PhoU [Deltaproteobacteria bacterium]